MDCRLGVVVTLVLVLVSGAVVGISAGAAPGASGSLVNAPPAFERTVFTIRVSENGSARWTVTYSTPLNNESQIDQFETYAARFNDNETDLYTGFREQARALTRAGSNATGRNMSASGFQKRAYVADAGRGGLNLDTRGVVELSFRWSNFATVDGEQVVVADVFEGGLYVGPDQWLVFEPGPNLEFADAQPGPDDMAVNGSLSESDSITYRGEQQFTDNRPYVLFEPDPATVPTTSVATATTAELTTAEPTTAEPTTTANATPGGGPGGDEPSQSDANFSILVFATLLVIVLGVSAAGVWYLSEREAVLPDESRPPVEPAATPGESQRAEATGTEPSVAEEEMLSDDDRVRSILEAHGGRMKQSAIVEETGWSKSKVSMLLSDMNEEGTISKIRVGRENIISLPGAEPDAAGSPFDDDEDS